MRIPMQPMRHVVFALMICVSGCATVADVAQEIADSARGSVQTPAEKLEPEIRGSASSQQMPCFTNFLVSGNFFSGKHFKTHVPLPALAPDSAYQKAYALVVKEGWQIISADKHIRMISASQGVNFSSGGKTVPINFLIEPGAAKGSVITLKLTLSGGLLASEDGVQSAFCAFVREMGGAESSSQTLSQPQPQPQPYPTPAKTLVRDIQAALRIEGYPVTVDGQYGPKTKVSITDWQSKNGLSADGLPTQGLLDAMNSKSNSNKANVVTERATKEKPITQAEGTTDNASPVPRPTETPQKSAPIKTKSVFDL